MAWSEIKIIYQVQAFLRIGEHSFRCNLKTYESIKCLYSSLLEGKQFDIRVQITFISHTYELSSNNGNNRSI